MSTSPVRRGIGVLASTIAVTGTVLAPGVAAADAQAPPAPTDLHVQNLSFTSVTLAWNPSADDSGWVMYEVEADALPRSVLRLGSTTPTKTVTGLVPGLTYTVSVVAVDGSRNMSAPASIQVTTPVDSAPPTAPSIVRPVTVTDAADRIWWSPSADSSTVRYVLRSSGSRIYGTTRTSVSAYELFGTFLVQPGSTHSITVEALDAHNNVSERSDPVSVTFP